MATILSQFTPSPMLANYAYGLTQSMAAPVANFLAPTVEVATAIGRYKKYTRKHAYHVANTARAIGGRATELTWSAEDATYNCTPNGIDVPIDYIQQDEASSMENLLQEAAGFAAEQAMLQHEKRVVDLATSTISSSVTIKPYKTTSPDDPIKIIDDYILEVVKAAGTGSMMGIRLLFGPTAWGLIKNSSSVRNRVVTAGAGGAVASGTPAAAAPNVTIDNIKNLFLGNPDCMLSLMVYDSAAEGKTPSLSFILDSDVLIFASRQSPSRNDPSFMKTFRPMGQWMVPGTYQRDDGRVTVAKFDWNADVQVTNSAAAIRVTLSSATS